MSRTSSNFSRWKAASLKLVEAALAQALVRRSLEQPPEIVSLFEAMGYALLGGGKRLRPLLALAAAEAVGGRPREALPAALAVEMIHAYSLIHDDLPAMDDDDMRRGRPTCHKVYGEGPAILAGDALLTLAFEVLAEGLGRDPETARRRGLAALHLAQSAGGLGMVGGQARDLAFERQGEAVDGAMVRDMESRKTGEMMSAALVCGAILAGGGPTAQRTMRDIGLNLGLAFQIQDDLLNLEGDPAVLGKAVGSDAERGKAGFPAVLGVAAARAELAALTEKALAGAASFKTPGLRLTELIGSLVNRQH
ncbi:MAG: polyprenyl synthetase family protein [Candidatus Adiutrix sp.]|nr:polyprenyl synthetase family protein [Candidatus Adiutrix sp.]